MRYLHRRRPYCSFLTSSSKSFIFCKNSYPVLGFELRTSRLYASSNNHYTKPPTLTAASVRLKPVIHGEQLIIEKVSLIFALSPPRSNCGLQRLQLNLHYLPTVGIQWGSLRLFYKQRIDSHCKQIHRWVT